MIGVAVTGERAWHASWWEWHGLIVIAYLVVGFAARNEWRDERFRKLYLATTRERDQEVSVLFSDLAGFTTFSERSSPAEVAAMLKAYYEVAPRRSSRRASAARSRSSSATGCRHVQHARRPARPRRCARPAPRWRCRTRSAPSPTPIPGWPRLRVGVNSGHAVVREMGGQGLVAYTVIGDTVNTGSRLEGQAPVGGVLIGAGTYERLPDGAVVEAVPGLVVKGKDAPVDAFVLRAMPPRDGVLALR